MGIKKLIRWADAEGEDTDGVDVQVGGDGTVTIHVNDGQRYTCTRFAPADFVEWVELEILPRYQAALVSAAKASAAK